MSDVDDDGGGRLGHLFPKTEMERGDRLIEFVSAALLALATVAIAWSGYQATRWGGEQSNAFAAAGADRVESVRASGLAETQAAIDVSLWTEWVDARAEGSPEQAAFYRERFRDEFKAPFQEWIDSDPLDNPDAAATPFALPSYSLEAEEIADRLATEADAAATEARQANQRGDNYVLAAVLYATVLFFAGISTKFVSRRLKAGGLAMAGLIFVLAFVWMLTMPVSFGV